MRADRGRGPLRPGDLRLPAWPHPAAEAEVRAGSAGQLPVGECERLGRRPGCRLAWDGVGGGGIGAGQRPIPALLSCRSWAAPPTSRTSAAGGSWSGCSASSASITGRLPGPTRWVAPSLPGLCWPSAGGAGLLPWAERGIPWGPSAALQDSSQLVALFSLRFGNIYFGNYPCSRCPRLLSGRPASPEPKWLSAGGGGHRLTASNVRPPGGSTQPSHIVNLKQPLGELGCCGRRRHNNHHLTASPG